MSIEDDIIAKYRSINSYDSKQRWNCFEIEKMITFYTQTLWSISISDSSIVRIRSISLICSGFIQNLGNDAGALVISYRNNALELKKIAFNEKIHDFFSLFFFLFSLKYSF